MGNFSIINTWANLFTTISNNGNIQPYIQGGSLPYDVYDSGYYYYVILIDHNYLAQLDQTAFTSTVTEIENDITSATLSAGIYVTVIDNLEGIISQTSMIITEIQVLLLVISIPVITLGWYLVKVNYGLSFNGRRHEVGLLKSKGATLGQIKSRFYVEAIITGVLGGVVGLIAGNFLSGWIYPMLYPSNLPPINSSALWTMILTFQAIKWMYWLIGIIASILLSLLAIRAPLNEFVSLDAIQAIAKYDEATETKMLKKKSDWFLFILGIFPIAFSIIQNFSTHLHI